MTRLTRPGLASLLAVIVISSAGCGASASVHLGGGSTLDHPDQSVSQALSTAAGESPKAVSCPEEVPAESGHHFRCVVTAKDGTRYGATVTESAVDGEHVHLHVQVDEQPVK